MTLPADSWPSRDRPPGEAAPELTQLDLLLRHQGRSWRRGARDRVEDYLAQQPGLGADADAVLDLIYNEVVLREEAGEAPGLAEYLARFPGLAPQLELQFEVEGALDPEATVVGRPRSAASAGGPAVAGYEILGELGRGGMGVVYKARQLRLNRIVALKMILAGDHAGPEDVLRFLAEAEAVARLSHPNIVQIYAFGDHEGRPYFEMEYAAGGNLADRLDGTPWPAGEAARLVETLARAVHEVHRLGFVHRDLKPANILVAADGTPKVADFGLAKLQGGEPGPTRTTRAVGSPSYMAPEQAGGRAGPVGPAADGYALGVILYELLTGRPPFRAATVLETLELVKSAEPVAPRRLRPGLPRDLATICLKCLEKEPARRYGSAAGLAADLRRFGAGRPILARPAGGGERLWRWCRREPASAGLALALAAGLTGVTTQWWRAEAHLAEAQRQRRRAEETTRMQVAANLALRAAHDREHDARRRAQERFDAAMKALGRFEGITKDPALLREPQLGGVRAKLLESALGFYRELQASLAADASAGARSQLSDAYARIAFVTWELGLQEEALAAYRQSLTLLEQLSAAAPADPALRAALAMGHARIGFTLRTIGRPDEALQSYERARAIQEPLARDHPTPGRNRETLSWTLSNLGLIHLELGDPARAIGFHRRAIAIHEAIVDRGPGLARYRSDLAWSWRHLGLALAASGDREAALGLVERSAALYESLDRDDPESRWRLARCLDEVGRFRYQAGRVAEAAGPLERAGAIHADLAGRDPALYGVDLIRNRLYRAAERELSGRHGEAGAYLIQAREDLGRCSRIRPEWMFFDMACAYCLWSVAGQDGAITPSGREARAGRAIATLRRAVAAGHRDPAQIRIDPVLDPLRSRPDFRDLVPDPSFPPAPFRP